MEELFYFICFFLFLLIYVLIVKLLKWKYQFYKRAFYFLDNKEYKKN